MAADGVRGVAVAVQEGICLGGGEESVEDGFAGEGDREGEKSAGEELCVDGDVGVELEEGGGGEGAEAVEAGEDFVEEDGEAGPVCGGDQRVM